MKWSICVWNGVILCVNLLTYTQSSDSVKLGTQSEAQKMIEIAHLELLKVLESGDKEKIRQAIIILETVQRKLEDMKQIATLNPANLRNGPRKKQVLHVCISHGPCEYSDLDKLQKLLIFAAGIAAGVPLIVMGWKFMFDFLGMKVS